MKKYIKLINQLANKSGRILRKAFRRTLIISSKGRMPSNTVTNIDVSVELALKKWIERKFPDHNIISEETKGKKTKSPYTWVIDPIDGTSAFVCGKHTFCTLIALLKNGKPILGVIDQPILRERWIGGDGLKTTLNKRKVRTAKQTKILRISATTPWMFNYHELSAYRLLAESICTTKNWGGDAYSYAMLASGHIDIVCESDLKIYDIAALIPIITGAGGIVTDWSGKPIDLKHFNHRVLACSNSIVFARAKKILKGH